MSIAELSHNTWHHEGTVDQFVLNWEVNCNITPSLPFKDVGKSVKDEVANALKQFVEFNGSKSVTISKSFSSAAFTGEDNEDWAFLPVLAEHIKAAVAASSEPLLHHVPGKSATFEFENGGGGGRSGDPRKVEGRDPREVVKSWTSFDQGEDPCCCFGAKKAFEYDCEFDVPLKTDDEWAAFAKAIAPALLQRAVKAGPYPFDKAGSEGLYMQQAPSAGAEHEGASTADGKVWTPVPTQEINRG